MEGSKKLTRNKAYHRRLIKRRSATVEPVLGTLLNYMNLRRVNTRGMAGANKHTLMAALCYNLKKYMKFSRTPAKVAAKAQTKSAGKPIKDRFFPLGQGIRSGTRLHLS